MTKTKETLLIGANTILGTMLLFLNYEPTWHRIFLLNIVVIYMGYFGVFIFIFLGLFHITQSAKQSKKRNISIVFHSAFVFNLLLNPLKIDSKPNNNYTVKIAGTLQGMTTYRRIVFDTSGRFYFLDSRNLYQISTGSYEQRKDTLFLTPSEPLIEMKDTLIFDTRGRLTYGTPFSQSWRFSHFDEPQRVRLDQAKQTTFQIID